MRSNITFIVISILLISLTSSCKKDDNYTGLSINTVEDIIQVLQNETTEINVLSNDSNIPSNGVLTVVSSENADIVTIDPNDTANDPSDDLILYSPNSNFTGQDSFEYTICDGTHSNCATGMVLVTVVPVSPVNFDIINVPYDKLSDYNFFDGTMSDLNPQFGVVPFEPISPLFSDYAHKKRFIWMPNNVQATYESAHEVLNMPIGGVLIKNFYYENVMPNNSTRIIETRLMIKKEGGWEFANYIWNEDQTEAFYDLGGGYTQIEWIDNGVPKAVNYQIPTESQCFTCHKAITNSTPIGIKPQNLNGDYMYESGIENQLLHLVNVGYLKDELPANIDTVVRWDDESQPMGLRVRSYFDINCAHCHSDYKHCDYRPMRFAFNESWDEVNLGVCVDPDTSIPPYTKIVSPGDLGDSILHFRFSTTEEQYRMPLFGRTLVHEEALAMVEDWIMNLNTICD